MHFIRSLPPLTYPFVFTFFLRFSLSVHLAQQHSLRICRLVLNSCYCIPKRGIEIKKRIVAVVVIIITSSVQPASIPSVKQNHSMQNGTTNLSDRLQLHCNVVFYHRPSAPFQSTYTMPNVVYVSERAHLHRTWFMRTERDLLIVMVNWSQTCKDISAQSSIVDSELASSSSFAIGQTNECMNCFICSFPNQIERSHSSSLFFFFVLFISKGDRKLQSQFRLAFSLFLTFIQPNKQQEQQKCGVENSIKKRANCGAACFSENTQINMQYGQKIAHFQLKIENTKPIKVNWQCEKLNITKRISFIPKMKRFLAKPAKHVCQKCEFLLPLTNKQNSTHTNEQTHIEYWIRENYLCSTYARTPITNEKKWNHGHCRII